MTKSKWKIKLPINKFKPSVVPKPSKEFNNTVTVKGTEFNSVSLSQEVAYATSHQIVGIDDRKQVFSHKETNDLRQTVILIQNTNPVHMWSRSISIRPQDVGRVVFIYQGKQFVRVRITTEMIGHYLGEFAKTRRTGNHKKKKLG